MSNPRTLPFNVAPPMEVFDAIYGRSDPDALIGMGRRKPPKADGEKGSINATALIRVGDRQNMLPTIFEQDFAGTEYIAPNTYGDSARYAPQAAHDAAIFAGKNKFFKARIPHVRELCAITMDLDVGEERGQITAGEAIGQVIDRCLAGILPTPSLAAMSGKGAYVMWLLADANSDDLRPPPHTPDNAARWRLCANELQRRLSDLKADPSAMSINNWYKRPGTIDTKTGRKVIYSAFMATDIRSVATYDLEDLLRALDLYHAAIDELAQRRAGRVYATPPKLDAAELVRTPRTTPRIRTSKRGQGSQPHHRRALEIEQISQHRGGLREHTCRHYAIWYYFQAIKAYLKMRADDDADAQRQAVHDAYLCAQKLNQTFRPPLPAADFKYATKMSKDVGFAHNATVAAQLAVTPQEVIDLELQSLLPREIGNIVKERERQEKRGRNRIRDAKRAAIDAALLRGEGPREISRRLKCSPGTVTKRRKKMEAMKGNTEPRLPFDD